MWVYDSENFKFLAVNEAAIELYGYSRREFLSMTAIDILPAEEVPRLLDARAHGKRLGLHFGGVWQHREKDGSVLDVDVASYELSFRGRPALLALLNDVTQLRKANEAVRSLSARLLKAQDLERRRLARELHDTAAQSLSSLAINMQILGECGAGMSPRARRALAESASLVEQCLREVRSLAYLLHPPILDRQGLGEALRWFVTGYSDRSQIKVHLFLPPDLGKLAPDVQLTIYRIVQEGLVNVQQHSASEVAAITVSRNKTEISVQIRDQGCGFKFPPGHEPSLGVGIPGMRERLNQLGGHLKILSSKRGTTVRAVIPLG